MDSNYHSIIEYVDLNVFFLYNKTEEFNQLLEESDDIHRRRQEATEMLKVFKKIVWGKLEQK